MKPPSQLADLTRRRRIALIVVLGGVCAGGPFATDLYLPGLPGVSADLNASAQTVALTLTALLIGLALGQVFAGPLSDAYGRRRPLLIGMGVFAVSSLLCALTQSAGMLVALRLVQGLAGAAGIVISNAVVTDYARGRKAARLLSRLAFVMLLAPIVAPLAGAQILKFTSWRGSFVALAAIGVLLFAGVALGLRESLPRARRTSGGIAGTLRTMGRLSRDLTFMGFALTAASSCVAFFAYLAAASFVYQDVYGASPVGFSVLFAINAVGMLIASQLNHLLLSRYSPLTLLGAGLVGALAAGGAVLGVTLAGDLSVVWLTVPLFLLVATLGLVIPNATALALSLHPGVAGSASAYFGTFRLAIGALATPLVGVGGAVSGLSMAIVIAAATLAGVAVYAAVAGRARHVVAVLDLPEEASAEMPVG